MSIFLKTWAMRPRTNGDPRVLDGAASVRGLELSQEASATAWGCFKSGVPLSLEDMPPLFGVISKNREL